MEEEDIGCKVCGKKALNKGYCSLHEKAHQNLFEKYEKWNKALGVSWDDYLIKVAGNPFTGSRAKEVAEALLSEKS